MELPQSAISAANELCLSIIATEREARGKTIAPAQVHALLINLASKANALRNLLSQARTPAKQTSEKGKAAPVNVSELSFRYTEDDGLTLDDGQPVADIAYEWATPAIAHRFGEALAMLPDVLRAMVKLAQAGNLPDTDNVLENFMALCGANLPVPDEVTPEPAAVTA